MIYLVRLNPGADPAVYKVGVTIQPTRRLSAIRTTAPQAILIATWEGGYAVEQRVLKALDRYTPSSHWGETSITRVGGEVFKINSVNGTVASAEGDCGSTPDAFVEAELDWMVKDVG